MTDQDLRDLLHDRVADLTTADLAPDLAPAAWRVAARRRARRRTAMVAGAAAAVVAVASVVTLVETGGDDGRGGAPASSGPTPTTEPDSEGAAPTATRRDDYRGAAVWEAPPAERELELPRWTEPSIPEVLDLSAVGEGPPETPVRGLLTEGRRVWALSGRGGLSEVDVSDLSVVSDAGGNRISLVSPYSLSPDGARAFFVQKSSLEVLELATGRWQSIVTPDWLAEGARWVSDAEIWVPDGPSSRGAGIVYELDGTVRQSFVRWVGVGFGADEDTWGPVASTRDRVAQTVFLAGPVDGTGVSNPEAVVVRTGDHVDVLTMWPAGAATRQKGCCEVLGFIDDDTLMFASKSEEGYRFLAWRVGTDDVYLVGSLAGPGALVAWRPAG